MDQKIITVVGPSGAGKSTLIVMGLKDFPLLEDAITHTTRSMRKEETEVHPYHFVTKQRFEQLIEEKFFVEWAYVHGNLYGVSRKELERIWNQNKVPILDVDVQGAKTLQTIFSHVYLIFVHAPSFDSMRKRLEKRGSDLKDIELRVEIAKKELEFAPFCHYQILNQEIEESYLQFKKIIETLLSKG